MRFLPPSLSFICQLTRLPRPRTFAPSPVELHYGAKYEEEACKSVDLATSFGTEAVDSVKNLAAFGQELQILRKLDMMQQPNYRERNKLAALAAFFFGFSQAIVPIILALFFWYGGHELANGNASISTVRLASHEHTFDKDLLTPFLCDRRSTRYLKLP